MSLKRVDSRELKVESGSEKRKSKAEDKAKRKDNAETLRGAEVRGEFLIGLGLKSGTGVPHST